VRHTKLQSWEQGFTTFNDLERHKSSVHGVNIAMLFYQCVVPRCRVRAKVWPRLDNFEQHLARMHPDEDHEMVIQRYLLQRSQLARALANSCRSVHMPGQAADTQVDLAPNTDPYRISQAATHELDQLPRLSEPQPSSSSVLEEESRNRPGSGNCGHISTGDQST
jgi:hypothetical protein